MPPTALDPSLRPILLSGSALILLGLIYFFLRFRLSRKSSIGPVSTPAIDRRNKEALDRMSTGRPADLNQPAPEDLLRAVDETNNKNP